MAVAVAAVAPLTKVRPHPTKPPKPVIDTNAYNGRNPIPAPSLPPAALNWMAGSTATLAAGTITATFTSQAILDVLAVAVTGFALEQAAGISNAPGVDPDAGSDADQARDCRMSGSGWRIWGADRLCQRQPHHRSGRLSGQGIPHQQPYRGDFLGPTV
ncbi:hypothetical protein GCM10020254_83220 [Streptomyces goshikiensis]